MVERRKGSIVAISSGLSRHREGVCAHSTAKSRTGRFVKSLALELGPSGVRVNVVAPGLTLTDATSWLSQKDKDGTAQMTPLRGTACRKTWPGRCLFAFRRGGALHPGDVPAGFRRDPDAMTSEAPREGALRRLEGILARVETLLGKRRAPPPDPAIFSPRAFRWERVAGAAGIVPIPHPHRVDLASLVGIDGRRRSFSATEQFVSGLGANDILLSGKRVPESRRGRRAAPSSARGLRIVELSRWDLSLFPMIVGQIRCPFRFLLFCDDLSFDEGRPTSGAQTLLDGVEERRRTC